MLTFLLADLSLKIIGIGCLGLTLKEFGLKQFTKVEVLLKFFLTISYRLF